MYDFSLISRDSRTEMLFRGPWHECLVNEGLSYIHLHSGTTLFRKLLLMRHNINSIRSSKSVLIFGLIESLLYSLFLGDRRAYFVITGFGRTWLNPITKIFIKFFFRSVLKDRRVAVLNHLDYMELVNLGCKDIYHLHGEGHPRLNTVANSSNILHQEDHTVEFIFVGRLLKSKGILSVLEFLGAINMPPWKINFTCIGDQDFDNADSLKISDLKQYEKSLNNLQLMGHRSDPWLDISICAVYISGSKREGLPFSVLEALHSGLYCVLSDVPGHSEFLDYPGVAILGQVSSEDLLLNVKKWHKVSLKTRLNTRFENLKCYSASGTSHEKLKFLELDKES